MARSRDDDYDDMDDDMDDRPRRRGSQFPTIVKVSAIIWIGAGALALLGNLLTIAMSGANRGQNAPGSICGIMLGVAFAICGYQTITGKAKDTLGNSIGSLVIAMLQFGIGAVMLLGVTIGAEAAMKEMKKNPNNPPMNIQELKTIGYLSGGLLAFSGSALGLAGVLGLAGRRSYLDWREAEGLAEKPRKKKKKRVEDDDDIDDDLDDRPKKRRRDD